MPQIYSRTSLPKHELIEDALEHPFGTASETTIFKEHGSMSVFMFCS